ncbi:hypothetical protein GP486_006027 [Trichoglossum hirsutum]|uniref:Phosphoglycerate mutase n=1 Tax=Trichoglossum hirsutum TaxID=265104 RepID=A0A9P8L845_9PEZI|nr:hypothetical protein GP486_006027 [Trichoglossum hirsutum]
MPDATGRPPAVVVIARHGARLDASDKQWHLTSPTPYDPPLTYGGWTQSRALGARIASVLHAREKSLAQGTANTNGAEASHDGVGGESESSKHGRTKRRKHKVVIHTSPFLRCVQTSIAISAGMAQQHGSHQPHPQPARSPHLHPQLSRSGPPVSPLLSATPEPNTEPSVRATKQTKSHKQRKFRKPTIRVDAVLGEWLSPDYFEMITPPPNSVKMVASAKAELLRPRDYSQLLSEARASRGTYGFPGGWGGLTVGTGSVPGDETFPSIPNSGQTPTGQDWPSSADNTNGGKSSPTQPKYTGYQSPPLTYAVSPSEPIPAGLVTHARDACAEVDYQWDSMREPQNWGDGGEYGEEWAAMHKRFRKGLDHLLSWYRDHDSPQSESRSACKNGSGEPGASQRGGGLEDDNTDIVVILVTHGAGCNALIGALTNQPVLLDVGMASLTIAFRKDIVNPPSPAEQMKPVSPIARSHGFFQDYDVKLIASTEHLRARSNSLVMSQIQSGSPTLSSYSPKFRNRHGTSGDSPVDSSFSIGESAIRSALPVGNGGARRNTTTFIPRIPSRAYSSSPGPRSGAGSSLGGLWSRPSISSETTDEESSDGGILLNFEDSKDLVRDGKEMKHEEEKRGRVDGAVGRHRTQPGLWEAGPPVMPGEERDRDRRRRWTTNES